jgi:hypothetical protein
MGKWARGEGEQRGRGTDGTRGDRGKVGEETEGRRVQRRQENKSEEEIRYMEIGCMIRVKRGMEWDFLTCRYRFE